MTLDQYEMRDAAQLQAIIYGRVQGVGFRHHTAIQARALGLNGWVRNNADGTVETIAVGNRPLLDQFLAWLHTGSPGASVRRVEVIWHDDTPHFAGFEIHYD